MTTAYALTDTGVMVTRCVRRSLRDPEAFLTALMLPIILMLMLCTSSAARSTPVAPTSTTWSPA
jgi:hypothetical protein